MSTHNVTREQAERGYLALYEHITVPTPQGKAFEDWLPISVPYGPTGRMVMVPTDGALDRRADSLYERALVAVQQDFEDEMLRGLRIPARRQPPPPAPMPIAEHRCPMCQKPTQAPDALWDMQVFGCPCVGDRTYVMGVDLGYAPSSQAFGIFAQPTSKPAPIDPLDIKYDGVALGRLLADEDERKMTETPMRSSSACLAHTAAQRAAVSAHWSAELRAKVKASAERERNRVLVDLQDEP